VITWAGQAPLRRRGLAVRRRAAARAPAGVTRHRSGPAFHRPFCFFPVEGERAYRVRLLLPLLIAEIKAGAYWDRAKGR